MLRALDRYDCADDLIVLANSFLDTCRPEHARLYAMTRRKLQWDEQVPPEYVEFMVLLFVSQLATLARSMVVVHRDHSRNSWTATPVSLFGRTLFEGLVYVDYLLTADQEERYVDLITSDEMIRNRITELGFGIKEWTRRRDTKTGRVPHVLSASAIEHCSDPWWSKADRFECAWLMRRTRDLDPAGSRDTAPAASVVQARDLWVKLGKRLSATDEPRLQLWQQRNHTWSSMSAYAFGMECSAAMPYGRLTSMVPARNGAPGSMSEPGSFLRWFGLTAANPYTHFSPMRVGPKPESDRTNAQRTLQKGLWMLLLVPGVLPDAYAWKPSLTRSADVASARLWTLAYTAGLP